MPTRGRYQARFAQILGPSGSAASCCVFADGNRGDDATRHERERLGGAAGANSSWSLCSPACEAPRYAPAGDGLDAESAHDGIAISAREFALLESLPPDIGPWTWTWTWTLVPLGRLPSVLMHRAGHRSTGALKIIGRCPVRIHDG
jgi:hypothetical protein